MSGKIHNFSTMWQTGNAEYRVLQANVGFDQSRGILLSGISTPALLGLMPACSHVARVPARPGAFLTLIVAPHTTALRA
jgi:hypothetical protein